MKRAYLTLRPQPHYRIDTFAEGLARVGFQVERNYPATPPGPEDILVIWNRYGQAEAAADLWEKKGGLVMVAENGYIGRDADGNQLYALAKHGHNGSGAWHIGGPERWRALRIDCRPWRPAIGGHVIIRGQRGIGSRTMASPPAWHKAAAERVKKAGYKPAVIEHPGDPANAPAVVEAMAKQWAGAWACYIWSSAIGVRALVEGVPVFFDAPRWIAQCAAQRGLLHLAQPMMSDYLREKVLRELAWAQWTLAEIASGEAFDVLLQPQKPIA